MVIEENDGWMDRWAGEDKNMENKNEKDNNLFTFIIFFKLRIRYQSVP